MAEPVSIAISITGLIQLAIHLSGCLYEISDNSSSASREFEVFSQEVNTFANVWRLVQPRLENPDLVLSNPALQTLHQILRTTKTSLRDLSEAVDDFTRKYKLGERVARRGFISWTTSAETQRRRHLKKFISRDSVKLYRSQLHYATSVLNILLAVVDRASLPRTSAALEQSEPFLFEEERRAKTRLRRQEAVSGPAESSAQWLPDVSDAQQRGRSRFEALAAEWTRPSLRPLTGRRDNEELEAYIRRVAAPDQQLIARLEERLDEQEAENRRIEADLRTVQSQLEEVLRSRAQERLEHQTIVRELRAELARLRETLQAYEDQEETWTQLKQDCERYRQGQIEYRRRRDQERERTTAIRQERDQQTGRANALQEQYDELAETYEKLKREANRLHQRLNPHSFRPPSSYQAQQPPGRRQSSSHSSSSGRRSDSNNESGSSRSSATYVTSSREGSRERNTHHARRRGDSPPRMPIRFNH